MMHDSVGGIRPRPIPWVLLSLALLLVACSAEQTTPEERIRALVASAEAAAEARSAGDLGELLSEHYADARGRGRKELKRLALGYFLRHKSIHLLTQIERIELLDEERARVVLFVAMAGSPLEGVEQLLNLRADLHRFELDLVLEQAQWRVARAHWQRARAADFR
ncbi:MAG: hypothetical protein B0D83_00090 [Candidatus Sedimenticola endophacoides]|nr:MAG: hypothetical protein B0D83_00090 [Candidatus Sedimenticola endophacoides]